MENNDVKIKRPDDNPEYFGAYLNMARHNMFLLVNRLTEKFQYLGFDKLTDDEDIADNKHILYKIFDPDEKYDNNDRFKVYKVLVRKHYLPLVKIFHEKNGIQLDENPIVDYENLHKFITEIFTLLNNLRNSYSHCLALDNAGNQTNTRKPVIGNFVRGKLKLLFGKSPEFSFERFNEKQTKENFSHLKKCHFFTNNQLSEHGFYFFINLFLERKYASRFLKKLRGFRNDTTPPFRATLQAFTAYCVTVPDERLGNEDLKQSLLMEILNELQRCPKELYRYLDEKDKQKFEPQIEEYGRNNIILNSTNYEDIEDKDIDIWLSELTTLKRSDDRFPYFALRFIDEFDLLPNIRFQIVLGKLLTDNYEKVISNVNVNRRIVKQVNAYGKLSDFENKEEEVLGNLGVAGETFDQFAPHYNLENNKIPFFLFDEGAEKIKYPQPLVNKKDDENLHNKPTGFISLNDLPKIALLAVDKPDEIERVIGEFITQNNTVILNFAKLNEIKNKLRLMPKELTRRIIKENGDKNKDREYIAYMQNRREELQKHLPGDVWVNQLPEQVLNFLLSISNADSKKLIHEKIKAIRDDCKFRIKKLSEKESKQPKKEEDLKKGEMATFLARDIIDMVIDKDVKQRVTNIYYNKLQNKIAFFNDSRPEIIAICKELKLFDKQKGHVFLTEILSTETLIQSLKSISSFYKKYLEAKINWIEKYLFIEDKKSRKSEYVLPEGVIVPYSIAKFKVQTVDKDFKKWLANKRKMPVELPNSLFGKIDTLKQQVKDTQPFYSFKRIYKIKDKEKTVDPNGLKAKDIKAKYGNRAGNNEKAIRFVQTQDRVLKRIAEKILSEQGNAEINFSLTDIMPFSGTSILNRPHSFRHEIPDTGYQIVAEENPQQNQAGCEWKVKDFGRFRKLLHDRRLEGLLAYFDNKGITYHFIEYQLSEYDRYREKIFELTFELEKQIATSFFAEIKADRLTKKRTFNEVQFGVYISLIKKKNILTADECEKLRWIRNKFSHTQFPKYYEEIGKLTQADNDNYESQRHVKGGVESLDLSICKKVYGLYGNLCGKVIGG